MRFSKACEVKLKRFHEVELLLQDPASSQDQKRLIELSKELKSLEKVALLYKEYQRLESESLDAQKMIEAKNQPSDLVNMAEQELDFLEEKKKIVAHDLEALFTESDPLFAKNVILEIRAGTGGLEAALFVGDIFRMYTRYAQDKKYKVEVLSSSPGAAGGFKEIIASVIGQGAFGKYRFESGTHRVQRVPATEAQGRIHTSAVTVAILPEAEEVDVDIRTEDLRIDVFRSGGPGGQSVNTTDSAVRITHIPSGLVVSCQDEKSQLKNKQKGLKILRARLFEKMTNDRNAKIAKERKEQVGSGDRSEKIRTYNFPDHRVTDHRIGFTLHNLAAVLDGGLEPLVNALSDAENKENE